VPRRVRPCWGRRGTSRGAVVVICSGGLDRGDTLETAMERLTGLCHRIVWVHPQSGPPRTLGMMVAAPHIDPLVPGRDLGSLAELAAMLPELG
jgi:uncharacterized protein with von Willebrand factor type A (vWA) domain